MYNCTSRGPQTLFRKDSRMKTTATTRMRCRTCVCVGLPSLFGGCRSFRFLPVRPQGRFVLGYRIFHSSFRFDKRVYGMRLQLPSRTTTSYVNESRYPLENNNKRSYYFLSKPNCWDSGMNTRYTNQTEARNRTYLQIQNTNLCKNAQVVKDTR